MLTWISTNIHCSINSKTTCNTLSVVLVGHYTQKQVLQLFQQKIAIQKMFLLVLDCIVIIFIFFYWCNSLWEHDFDAYIKQVVCHVYIPILFTEHTCMTLMRILNRLYVMYIFPCYSLSTLVPLLLSFLYFFIFTLHVCSFILHFLYVYLSPCATVWACIFLSCSMLGMFPTLWGTLLHFLCLSAGL
jgi:hypothetical protein